MRELKLKPSRRLGWMTLGLGLLAGVAVTRTALPIPWQAGLIAGTCLATFWQLRRMARVPRMALADDGSLNVREDDGDWRKATVLPDSFVSPAMIVMRYQLPGARARSLTLLPDSASTDDFRRLRASLRWARRTRSDTSSPDEG
ncbi:MAG: hypothetical protein LDL16_07015 [Thiobacillus sp.]|nr:hypothetical protein [Thiobacillus sp.]